MWSFQIYLAIKILVIVTLKYYFALNFFESFLERIFLQEVFHLKSLFTLK
jgi:hypothetical protein